MVLKLWSSLPQKEKQERKQNIALSRHDIPLIMTIRIIIGKSGKKYHSHMHTMERLGGLNLNKCRNP